MNQLALVLNPSLRCSCSVLVWMRLLVMDGVDVCSKHVFDVLVVVGV